MAKVLQLEERPPRAVIPPWTGIAIPPLSQSRREHLACPALYRHLHVAGQDQAYSEAADRGGELHRRIATYVKHLLETRKAADEDYLALLLDDAPADVAPILERFGETYVFDPERVYATEWKIRLDEQFRPLQDAGPAAYEGTLDLVQLLYRTTAVIDDWKSHWKVFAAETFQSKLYPLLVFSVNPAIERVAFRLQFLRWGQTRDVEWTREDVPRLKELAKRERARQLAEHEGAAVGKAALAKPGGHCVSCPLLLTACPVREVNPYAHGTPTELLEQALYHKAALAKLTATLKDL